MERKKILIVEDEHEMRLLLNLSLSACGYDTFEAADGETGLREAVYVRPDLILLDVMLPKVEGYEVCARLKADPHSRKIPVLMFTARTGDMDRFIGLQCGADDYLSKPFEEDVFLDKIRKLLEGHSHARLN